METEDITSQCQSIQSISQQDSDHEATPEPLQSPLKLPDETEQHMETDEFDQLPQSPIENQQTETDTEDRRISPIIERKDVVERMEFVQQYLEAINVQGAPLNLCAIDVLNQNIQPPNIEEDKLEIPIDNEQVVPDVDADVNSNELIKDEEKWRSQAVLAFKVENLSKLTGEHVYSPEVFIRYLPWRIMTMVRFERRGNKEVKGLCFFVQCNNESKTTWSCHAYATLKLYSFKPDVSPYVREIEHLYTPVENDWGYSHFMLWEDLFDPEKGYVKDDAIMLEAHVKADPPHGAAFDSKRCTGYVGLKNQGATCYMNSLLQALYFTNEFRKAVYKIPTEADNPNDSIALNLQKVFHNMHISEKSVGTLKLAKSFGWETVDLVMQHDIQEFLRLLLDRLEDRMKGTCVEGTIPRIFEGKMSSYIKCRNVDFESRRIETFYDIQLNIKNKKNIYDSFDDYIQPEVLEGENKYDAGPHGFQIAEKGLIFLKFPPVLYLQLMRTQYDPIQNRNFKMIDYFEFYEEINLDRYLAHPETTPANYKLHTVLVHTGLEAQAGHYVAYINPHADGIWFKFDDEIVSRSCKDEAINQNFGGNDLGLHTSCAYMLIYVRTSALPRILSEVRVSDIPSEVLERFQEDKRAELIKKLEHSETNRIVVKVFLEDSLEQHHLADLFDWEKAHYRVFRLKPLQTVKELSDLIASSFIIKDHKRFRFWPILMHTEVSRPMCFDKDLEYSTPISALADPRDPLPILLQLASPENCDPLPPFNEKQDRLIFFKFYDPYVKRLMYLGCEQYSISQTLSDLTKFVNKQLGVDPNFSKYVVYEEIGHYKLQRFISLKDKLGEILKHTGSEVCGNLLIFEKEKYDDMAELEIPTVDKFYEFLPFRVEVTFLDKMNLSDTNGFTLELSHRDTYLDVAGKVAKVLEVDPQMIQFYSTKDESQPYLPFRYNSVRNWKLMELLGYNKPNIYKFFYQKLNMDIAALESKKQYRCLWLSPDHSEQKELMVYVDKEGNVKNLKCALEKQLVQEGLPAKNLRIIEVSNCKIRNIPEDDTPLEDFPNLPFTMATQHTFYRVEEIPEDQLNLKLHEMLIPVFHFHKDTNHAFGIPFLIKIHQGEHFSTIKDRIKKFLEVTHVEGDSYKILFFTAGGATYLSGDCNTVDLACFRLLFPSIGIEHQTKSRKRPSTRVCLERALKMCAAKGQS